MDVFFDHEALENFMNSLGFWGPIIFFLLQVLQAIIIPLPGNILTMVGGALFGIWPGFLLAYMGNVVGSLIGFLIVRKVGRAAMEKLMGARRFDKYMEIISSDSTNSRAKILLILVVLLPFLPSDFMCLAVGLSSISFRTFFVIVITCRPWGQLAAAFLGVSGFHMPGELLFLFIAVIIAICAAGVYCAPRIEAVVFRWTYKISNRFGRGKNIA